MDEAKAIEPNATPTNFVALVALRLDNADSAGGPGCLARLFFV